MGFPFTSMRREQSKPSSSHRIPATFYWDTKPDHPAEKLIERLFPNYDLVLVEGCKQGPFPKIELYRDL